MSENKLLDRVNADTATPIDVHVSPTMHPDAISSHGPVLCDGGEGRGRAGYSAGRSALRAMYQALGACDKAKTALLEPVPTGAKGSGALRAEVPKHRCSELATAMAGAA